MARALETHNLPLQFGPLLEQDKQPPGSRGSRLAWPGDDRPPRQNRGNREEPTTARRGLNRPFEP